MVRSGSFRLPLIVSALWLVVAIVGGLIYPAVVQALVVNPNQEVREAPYIERNVTANAPWLGITDVDVRTVDFQPLTADDVEANLQPLANARRPNPAQMETRFVVDRGEVAGLTIDDLDVDRYVLDGDQPEQVLIAARELDLGGVTNKSWQGLHLSTPGGGAWCWRDGTSAGEPASRLPQRRPRAARAVFQSDADRVRDRQHRLVRAGVLRTARVRGHQRCRDELLHQARAFALAFLDYNVLGAGAVTDDSQMLWVRGVNDRLNKLAPFLSYDADPYPVAVDGRAVWVTDAYTTSTRIRTGSASVTCNAPASRACPTATTTSATASRPWSMPTPARSRST